MSLKRERLWLLALPLVLAFSGASDGAQPIRFTLANASPYKIKAAYVSPTENTVWGDNLLTEGALLPKKKATVEFTGECGTYDIRFVSEEKIEFLDEDVALCDDDDIVTIGKSTLAKTKKSKSDK